MWGPNVSDTIFFWWGEVSKKERKFDYWVVNETNVGKLLPAFKVGLTVHPTLEQIHVTAVSVKSSIFVHQ